MIFSKWDIGKKEVGEFFLEGIHEEFTDDYRELHIHLQQSCEENGKHNFTVSFKDALCYRSTSTGDFSKSSYEMNQKGCFFILGNTDFLRWFHEESFSSWLDHKVHHYKMITSLYVVDVLCIREPIIKW